METGLQYTNIHSCSNHVLANRVHLLLIVLPHLLTFSIHFIHCSEIIDVIQQNCGFDNCRQEITRIGLPWTSNNFLSYRHVFMDANVSILYVQVFAFNKHLKGPSSMDSNKSVHTSLLSEMLAG